MASIKAFLKKLVPRSSGGVAKLAEGGVDVKDFAAASGEGMEVACFAAGCFWGVETTLAAYKGVMSTAVGYVGGQTKNPTYKQVCYSETGHAEAVLLSFNPKEVSFDELLDVLFGSHNPTTFHRQGPDIGSQYRSAVFYFSEAQKAAAESAKERWQPKFAQPIVTQISAAPAFYLAEQYHQKYALQTSHPRIFQTLEVKSARELVTSPLVAKINGYVVGEASKEVAAELLSRPMPEVTRDLLKSVKFAGPACALHH